MFKRFLFFGLILMLFSYNMIFAQTVDEQTNIDNKAADETKKEADKDVEKKEKTSLKLNEIVITASRTKMLTEDVPGRVNVIAKDQIQNTGVSRLDEAFRLVSGINDQRTTDLFSSSSSISMRGLGSEPGRSLILMDGVPVNKGETGEVNWNRIDIDEVQRLEIFKGPGSSVYGNNAMGGVINILSRKPVNPIEGHASVGYGTFNTLSSRFGISGKPDFANGGYYKLNGFYNGSDGYIQQTDEKKALMESKHVEVHKSFIEELGVGATLGYEFNNDNSVWGTYSYYNDKRSENQKISLKDGMYREYDTNAGDVHYRGAGDKLSWQVDGFFSREDYKRRVESINTTLKYTQYDVLAKRDDYGSLMSVSYNLNSLMVITAGTDIRVGKQDSVDHYNIVNDLELEKKVTAKGTLSTYAVFLQDEIYLLNRQLVFLLGARVDWAHFTDGYYYNPDDPLKEFNGDADEKLWWHVSPRAGVRFTPVDMISIYGSYSQGFRASILDDLCRAGIMWGLYKEQNPNLKPETVDNYELGVDLKPIDDLKITNSAFYSIGRGFLYYVKTGRTILVGASTKDLYHRDNVGRVDIYGYEADAKYSLKSFDSLLRKITLLANYTYNHTEIKEYVDSSLVGKRLAYVPSHQASAGFEWLNKFCNVNVLYNWKSMYYTDDSNTSGLSLGKFNTIDLRFWINIVGDWFNIGDRTQGTIALRIQNVLDNRFATAKESNSGTYITSSEAPGRMISLEASVKY
jgi:iron complex outermembrane recepter protein